MNNSHTEKEENRLHVLHSLGGGIEKWVNDFIKNDIHHNNFILKSLGIRGIFGQKIALYRDPEGKRPLSVWDLKPPIDSTAITHTNYRALLKEIIGDYRIKTIIISSLIGHSLDILNTGLKTVMVLHDYYPYCPAVNLFFNKICSSCEFDQLASCFKKNRFNKAFPLASSQGWLTIRNNYLKLIRTQKVSLVAPSDSVKRNLLSLAPSLSEMSFRVIPHGSDRLSSCPRNDQSARENKLRILVLGRLTYHKGLQLFEAIYPELSEGADFYLLGCGWKGRKYSKMPGIQIMAENYSPEQLNEMVGIISPDLGLLLSIWPETFSYTLSELMMLGIPPLVTQVGSFTDRIINGETGFIVEPEKMALINKIKEVSEKKDMLPRITSNLGKIAFKTTDHMVLDYNRLISQIAIPADSGSEQQTCLLKEEELKRIKDQSFFNTYFKKITCSVKNQILNFKSN
jgi:glycosyltransferase involved in cell wall biosynthesis